RASHDGIDIGVVPHIKCASGSGPGGDGENRNKSSQRIELVMRTEQSNDRSEDSEHHDARFGELEEVGQAPTLGETVRGMRRRGNSRPFAKMISNGLDVHYACSGFIRNERGRFRIRRMMGSHCFHICFWKSSWWLASAGRLT